MRACTEPYDFFLSSWGFVRVIYAGEKVYFVLKQNKFLGSVHLDLVVLFYYN